MSNDSCVTVDNAEKCHSPENVGMLVALCSRGVQDEHKTAFDARLIFLTGNYQRFYQRVTATATATDKSRIQFELVRDCDLINCVDLVLPNPDNSSLAEIIQSVEICVGGQRVDKMCSHDIDVQVKTNCEVFGRTLTHLNGKTFVPLCMAPLHAFNLFLVAAMHHSMTICIEFKPAYASKIASPCKEVLLYGNRYFLDPKERAVIADSAHEYQTIQNQSIGKYTMTQGTNTYKIPFNHQLPVIYLFGFDKSKVTNVKLMLNDWPFYDGPIEPLEHYKFSRGIHAEPLFLWFSASELNEPIRSTVNFSQIDRASIVIETDEVGEREVSIVGLSLQTIRFSSGMFGLKYTK